MSKYDKSLLSLLILKTYRFLFARKIFYKFNKGLFLLSARGIGLLNYENEKVSGEKYLINSVLPKFIIKKNPILFDVGSNVGDYSNMLLKSFPNSTIHSFEPHPKNFDKLIQNTQNKSIINNQLALGSQMGTLSLFDKQDLDGSHHATIFEFVITELHHSKSIEYLVNIDTLDNYCNINNIEYIDFIKIDTEGNDFSVLEGGINLLKTNKIGIIHFEFNEMNVVSRVFMRDFRKLLVNYNLFRLLPDGLIPLTDNPLLSELFAFQNIIAIPQNN